MVRHLNTPAGGLARVRVPDRSEGCRPPAGRFWSVSAERTFAGLTVPRVLKARYRMMMLSSVDTGQRLADPVGRGCDPALRLKGAAGRG